MDYEIRACRLEDAAALQRLNSQQMGYTFSVEETEAKMRKVLGSDRDRIFVAVSGDQVLGYVHANDHDVICLPHMKNIQGIAVAAACQKQGIGRALLQAVEAWARESGAVGIRLVSGSTRTEAHAFYRSCGYECKKTQCNFKKYF